MSSLCQPPAGPALSRPRVLLLAYACSPEHGSEGGIGWHRALETARHCDTWVVMVDNFYAEGVRRRLASGGEIPGLHFAFVPKARWQQIVERVPGLYYVAYHGWHRLAFRRAAELHAQVRFDLVHQVNFCGYREPGYLWRLDAPFVWGPVGGTQDYPWRFLGEAGFPGALTEAIRTAANYLQFRFSYRVRQAVRKASVLLAANSTNRRDFERVHGIRPQLMLETGIEPTIPAGRRRDSQRAEVRILWSGAHIPRKCLSLLLRALAVLPADCPYRLRVLGRGPRTAAWQKLARQLGVAQHIEWIGWVAHDQVAEQYRWADLFAFTSLRDTSGNVVLEALGAGLPVVCLDHQGVHDIVTSECGIKIPVTSRAEVIRGLADAFARLAKDHAGWEQHSAAAVRRAEEYSWSRQADRMAQVYRQLLAPGAALADAPALQNGLLRADQPATAAAGPPAFRRDARHAWSSELGRRAAAWTGAAIQSLSRNSGSRTTEASSEFGIFNYHRVAPHVPGLPKPTINVTPGQLRQHLAGLQARGYVIRPLSEMVRHHRLGTNPPPRSVVLTFDDGFASVYEQAWPILREFNAPATLFLCTAYLGNEEPFPFDGWGLDHRQRAPAASWRPLRVDECHEMLSSGLVELGAHTHTHQDFRARPADFAADVRQNVAELKSLFGVEHVPLAFPYGAYNEALLDEARQAGVSCALTVDARLVDVSSDPFGWGRHTALDWDTASTLSAKREGWYGRVLDQFRSIAGIARRRSRGTGPQLADRRLA